MTTITAVRIHETGGPEVMKLEQVNLADPGPGEVRVRHKAIGLNFIDTYHRSGLYPVKLPSPLGVEASGVVEALGEGVETLKEGDRVAFGSGALGGYAEASNVAASGAVKLPDQVSFEEAAAMMLKGMTAQFLLRQTYKVQAGDTILIHAAAGGVGLIACQWAKHLGATVIGTAGSDEKAALAKAHGADHVILYRDEDVAARVRELTGGQGVPVVYDAVGKDTWEGSLNSLAPLGMMVSFGNASGPAPDISPLTLAAKGSLFLTRPILFHYIATPDAFQKTAGELMEVVASGAVKVEVNQTYPLADVVTAHQDLQARKTTGSTVLIP